MEFKTKTGTEQVKLAGGMVRDTSVDKIDYSLTRRGPMYQRWTQLLTRGAKHYGKNNWTLATKSMDLAARSDTKDRFKESALRHFEQWYRGDLDEDHAAAIFFNVNGYEAMVDTDPTEAQLALEARCVPSPIPAGADPMIDYEGTTMRRVNECSIDCSASVPCMACKEKKK